MLSTDVTREVRTLSPSEEMRLAAGVLAQPFVAAIVAFLIFPAFLLDRSGHYLSGRIPDTFVAARSAAFGAGLLAIVLTLLVALPAAVWLTKRKRVSLSQALLYGLGIGNLPMILGTIVLGAYGIEGFVRGVLFSSVLGMACAAMFWVIALRGQQVETGVSPAQRPR